MKRFACYSVCWLSILAACFLTSCGSGQVGRNFRLGDASRIEIGKTTKAEVLELFGEPLNVIEAANLKRPRVHSGGEEAVLLWLYVYGIGSLSGSSARSMEVEFNAAGCVIDYHCDSTFPEDAATR